MLVKESAKEHVMKNGCLGSSGYAWSTNRHNVQWWSVHNSCTFLKHNIYNGSELLQHFVNNQGTKYHIIFFILQLWANDLSRQTQHPVFLQQQTTWSVRIQTLTKGRHTCNYGTSSSMTHSQQLFSCLLLSQVKGNTMSSFMKIYVLAGTEHKQHSRTGCRRWHLCLWGRKRILEKNAYKVVVEKPDGKRLLGRLWHTEK